MSGGWKITSGGWKGADAGALSGAPAGWSSWPAASAVRAAGLPASVLGVAGLPASPPSDLPPSVLPALVARDLAGRLRPVPPAASPALLAPAVSAVPVPD
jgi:hypothetical protein